MNNKILIGLLVFLFVLSCGVGGWGYYQFDKVKSDTQALRQETSAQIKSAQNDITSLGTDLNTFKGKTDTQFAAVQNNVATLNSGLTTFESSANAQFGTIKSDVSGLNTGLTSFEAQTAAQFAESTMDVRKVYGDAVSSVCQITDGENRLGSGFVFDTNGHIITAWHVISDANNVVVILHDGTLADATIVGSDKYSDVAVLKLKDNLNLTPLELANSDNVARGEPVIVVGTPFELSDSVTYGVISRNKGFISFPGGDWAVCNLIQYDAATNPGNSGGPVINAKGQVIGIAAYTITAESGSGISWCVSSNKINRVANAIINTGSFHDAVLPGPGGYLTLPRKRPVKEA